MTGEEGEKGRKIMPALSGAKGNDGSHVHSEGHKSARVKKKRSHVGRLGDELWRKEASFGHLVAPMMSTLFDPLYESLTIQLILHQQNQTITFPSCF